MAILALVAFVLSPALMLAAMIMAIRAPGLKFRWLWCLGSLIAVSQWGFTFATGASKFVAMHGAVIGSVATYHDTPPAGWTIKSAIPLGAIVVIAFLLRRRKIVEDKAAQDIPPP